MIRLLHVLLRTLKRSQWRDVGRLAVITVAILAYATSGFLYFELADRPDLTWADAFWWAVVTMTTVGYGDLFPTTLGGRYLIGLPAMLFGISVLGYLLSVVASYLIESRGKELRGLGTVRSSGHVLVINYPGVQRLTVVLDRLAADTRTRGRAVVLVDDRLEELPAELAERGVRYVRGPASRTETLERAKFREARIALILARDPHLPESDDRSLAAALTLEKLHAELVTTVECVDPEHVELFWRAGVDNVVCLDRIGTNLLVHESLDSGVLGVVAEITTAEYGQQLYLVPVEASGSRFGALAERLAAHRVMALGVVRGRETTLNPGPDLPVEAGDRLVCLATERPDAIKL